MPGRNRKCVSLRGRRSWSRSALDAWLFGEPPGAAEAVGGLVMGPMGSRSSWTRVSSESLD